MVKVLKTRSQLMGWWQGGRTWLTIPSLLYGGQFVPWHIPAMVCYLLTGHRAQGPTQRAEPRYELIVSVFPMGEEHWLKLAITYHFCKIQMWNPKSGSPSSLEPCLWTFLDFVFFSLNIYQSVTGKHNKRMKNVEEHADLRDFSTSPCLQTAEWSRYSHGYKRPNSTRSQSFPDSNRRTPISGGRERCIKCSSKCLHRAVSQLVSTVRPRRRRQRREQLRGEGQPQGWLLK